MTLPIFGFANAGVHLGDFSLEIMFSGIPLGIALGLFVGKQVGVSGFSWLAVKLGIAKLSDDVDLPMIYGISLLTGVGFTMSLFISGLAFDDPELISMVKVDVLTGSVMSDLSGYMVLHWVIGRLRAAPA